MQFFLEFTRFYKQFIAGFSQITKLLTKMIKNSYIMIRLDKSKVKYNFFQWTKNCEKVFQNLKQVFITTLVLAYYDLKLKTYIKTNFSNFVTVSVLLQMHNKILRPVIYSSKKLTLAKYNYMIYNKKVFVIGKSFKVLHLKLISATSQVKIYTNHKNLEYFMIIK